MMTDIAERDRVIAAFKAAPVASIMPLKTGRDYLVAVCIRRQGSPLFYVNARRDTHLVQFYSSPPWNGPSLCHEEVNEPLADWVRGMAAKVVSPTAIRYGQP